MQREAWRKVAPTRSGGNGERPRKILQAATVPVKPCYILKLSPSLRSFMNTSTLVFTLIFPVALQVQAQEAHPLLTRFDADKSGFLKGEEIPAMLAQRMTRMDADGDGQLSSTELERVPQRAVDSLLKDGGASMPSRAPRKPGEVVTPPARGERAETSLKVGDDAPDFTLARWNGEDEVTLSSFEGEKPVVLIFGSITCSPFRQRVLEVKPLYEEYQDRAEFLMIYIREAHPESIIEVPVPGDSGEVELRKFEQTDDFGLRQESASYCERLLDLPWPVLVDKEDNQVKDAYAGWPIRLVVIGKDGKLQFDSGQGPGGFQPSVLAQWLEANL